MNQIGGLRRYVYSFVHDEGMENKRSEVEYLNATTRKLVVRRGLRIHTMTRGRLLYFDPLFALLVAVSSLFTLRYAARATEYGIPTFYLVCFRTFGIFKAYRHLAKVQQVDAVEH